jgi:hypothetical protein
VFELLWSVTYQKKKKKKKKKKKIVVECELVRLIGWWLGL